MKITHSLFTIHPVAGGTVLQAETQWAMAPPLTFPKKGQQYFTVDLLTGAVVESTFDPKLERDQKRLDRGLLWSTREGAENALIGLGILLSRNLYINLHEDKEP